MKFFDLLNNIARFPVQKHSNLLYHWRYNICNNKRRTVTLSFSSDKNFNNFSFYARPRVDKFLSRRPTFRARNLTCAPSSWSVAILPVLIRKQQSCECVRWISLKFNLKFANIEKNLFTKQNSSKMLFGQFNLCARSGTQKSVSSKPKYTS